MFAQDLARSLLDELGLPLFCDEYGSFAAAETYPLFRHERIVDVENVQGHLARAEHIGAPEQLERSQCVVVEATLQDYADFVGLTFEQVVHAPLGDET